MRQGDEPAVDDGMRRGDGDARVAVVLAVGDLVAQRLGLTAVVRGGLDLLQREKVARQQRDARPEQRSRTPNVGDAEAGSSMRRVNAP
jgi:hypothetical protein